MKNFSVMSQVFLRHPFQRGNALGGVLHDLVAPFSINNPVTPLEEPVKIIQMGLSQLALKCPTFNMNGMI